MILLTKNTIYDGWYILPQINDVSMLTIRWAIADNGMVAISKTKPSSERVKNGVNLR